jgi:hypothetical protein
MANEENGNSNTLPLNDNEIAALKHSVGQAQAFLTRLSSSLGAGDFEAAPHEAKLLHQIVSSYKGSSGDQVATDSLLQSLTKTAEVDPIIITGCTGGTPTTDPNAPALA